MVRNKHAYSPKKEDFIIRRMVESDNLDIARFIRAVIDEYSGPQKDSVYDDPSTDCLYQSFKKQKAEYWVIDYKGKAVGGCGYYPTEGLPRGCAEIVKFYIMPIARGCGLGGQLMDIIINQAREAGYSQLYIETIALFSTAVEMYKKRGFELLDQEMGNTGHSSMEIFMIKTLV